MKILYSALVGQFNFFSLVHVGPIKLQTSDRPIQTHESV